MVDWGGIQPPPLCIPFATQFCWRLPQLSQFQRPSDQLGQLLGPVEQHPVPRNEIEARPAQLQWRDLHPDSNAGVIDLPPVQLYAFVQPLFTPLDRGVEPDLLKVVQVDAGVVKHAALQVLRELARVGRRGVAVMFGQDHDRVERADAVIRRI